MRTESEVHLVKPVDNSIVVAKLVINVTIDEVDEAVGLWSPYLDQQIQAGLTRPQHAHWEWDKKARRVKGNESCTICGIMVESEMQALMLWEDLFGRAKHPDQKENPLVLVEFLAVAPWNDRDIVPTPSYRGCGTLLLKEGVEHSMFLGYRGRVGLHSLPQAEPFYREKSGMIDLGKDPDPEHQGLRYFEFTKERAQIFLSTIKGKGGNHGTSV